MGTEVSFNGNVVAKRSATRNGPVVQMEFTEAEWPNWREAVVETECGWLCTFADFVAEFKRTKVVFDSAARQNAMARDMEDHRFELVRSFAGQHRTRARHLARTQLVAVS